MMELKTTGKFRKDYKRCKKRGLDMSLLENVIDLLLTGNPLPREYKDHPLVGDYPGFRECHVMPDWLLIYEISDDKLILTATRTGTHSDVFDE